MAFMYSIRNGRYFKYEGTVRYQNCVFDHSLFICNDKKQTTLACANNPGELYNNSVWFDTNAEKAAIEILIKDQMRSISVLELRISRRKNAVKNLRKVLKDLK